MNINIGHDINEKDKDRTVRRTDRRIIRRTSNQIVDVYVRETQIFEALGSRK